MKKVVILGGGVAGLQCASTLTNQSSLLFDITLVEKKDFVESGLYSLRMMAQPDEFEPAHVMLQELEQTYRRNGHCLEFVTSARATALNELVTLDTNNGNVHEDSQSRERRRTVTIAVENDNGTEERVLEYDYLVLATGSLYSTPYVKPDPNKQVNSVMRRIELQTFHQQIHSPDNNHVVVVGGGALGLELVGELADLNETRRSTNPFKITLIHSRMLLKDRSNSQSIHNYIMDFMQRNQVEVILGHRVSSDSPHFDQDVDPAVKKKLRIDPNPKLEDVSPSTVTEINDASMVFWCGSLRPNTDFITQDNENRVLIEVDSSGFVKVNTYLQCEGYENVFAVGDLNNSPCEKLAGAAAVQAQKAAQNIIQLAAGKRASYQYRGDMFRSYSLSLGSKDAFATIADYMVLWGGIAAYLKTNTNRNKLVQYLRNS